MKRLGFHHLVVFGAVLLLATAVAAEERAAPLLETGYAEMYDLQFGAAHQSFHDWQQRHRDDPMGPVSDAAAYLFSEFNRLHVLEVDLFVNDHRFESRERAVASPLIKQAFQSQLDRARELAGAALARNPRDTNALLADVLVLGLQADYLAMIEKHDFEALKYIKQGRAHAQQLLAEDPNCYDAYLAIGVENYLLSQKPMPVRWILRLGGAQTDKAAGLEKLRLAAEKGHYLLPYARLLLAVAALRDHDRDRARELLAGLARQFPHNYLYTVELAKLE